MDGVGRRKLEWRCRRGTRELDALMTAYLRTHYDQVSESEQDLFEALTEWQDPELYDLLVGRMRCEDEALNRLADVIRATSQA